MTHPADLDPVLREQILARLRARPALWDRYVHQTGGDESFGLWLFTLDATIARTAGLTHTDLPDQPWRDEHDAGTDPVRYARHVITTELTHQHPWAGGGVDPSQVDPSAGHRASAALSSTD